MTVKQIPLMLLGGMFIGLMALGVFFFFKAVNILDSSSAMPGASEPISFFKKSEVEKLQVVSAKNGLRKVWVYYFDNDKFNETTSFGYTSPVFRETSRSDIATFAMEEIIRGPNEAEAEDNLKKIFGDGEFVTMTGDSTCSGKDAVVNLNMKEGMAQVHFCKSLTFVGDAAPQILSEILHKTYTQFDTIHKVRILNNENNCFDGTIAETSDDCVY